MENVGRFEERSNEKEERLLSDSEAGEFEHILLEDTIRRCASALEAALAERRDYLVQGIFSRIAAALRSKSGSVGTGAGKEWVEIESLSSLRALVGGRFASLKKKWVDAGFPLRQHRGDKAHDYKIREEGWIELAAWIAKQGFEAKLATPEEDCPIKIRQLGIKGAGQR